MSAKPTVCPRCEGRLVRPQGRYDGAKVIVSYCGQIPLVACECSIRIAAPPESELEKTVAAIVSGYAKQVRERELVEVEQRLLAGENEVRMPYMPGLLGPTDKRTVVYRVPSWRRQPWKRLRVETYRFRHRRGW